MAKCLDDLIKAGKGLLTRKDAEQIIADIEKKFNRKMPKAKRNIFDPGTARREGGPDAKVYQEDGSPSPERRMQEAAIEAYQEKLRDKSEFLRRQEKQVELQFVRQTQLARLGSNGKALLSMLTDPNGELTLQGRQRGIREQYYGGLYPSIKSLAKDKEWKSLKLAERDAMLAEALMDPDLVKNIYPKPGTDQRADLQKKVHDLALKFREIDNDAFIRKNEAGADIKYVEGHSNQSWDPTEVRLFGLNKVDRLKIVFAVDGGKTRRALVSRAKARWTEYMMEKVDRERYIDDETGVPLADDEMREVLDGIWQTLASNGADQSGAGTGELARRLSASREIWFKDSDGWAEANREFGAKNMFDAIISAVDRHSRELALLETYGPNPASGYQTDVQFIQSAQAIDNPGAARKATFLAQIVFDELSGKNAGVPEDRAAVDNLARYDLVSRFFQGVRNSLVASKLGSLLLSQVNDLAIYRAMARVDGLGAGKPMRVALSMFNPANAADRRTARRHGILAQMVMNDAAIRHGGDTGTGQSFTSKMANFTVKAGGAQHWTDSLKQAFQISIGQHLSDARKLEFDQLEGAFGELVQRYGITADEWDVIRRSESVKLAGYETVTPHTVARSFHPDMGLNSSPAKAKKAAAVVREASLKVGAMMAEEADIAILTPGAKERARVVGSTKAGTLSGELVRSFMFFRLFSVALVTKAAPRIGAASTLPVVVSRLTGFALASTIAGAMTIQLKELSRGNNPRDMTEADFWGKAFMQGGGLGFFGDFLFTEANRYGGGMYSAVGGPVTGFIADMHKLTVGNIQQGLEGRDPRLAAESLQIVKNYAPLMNLWYTRLALDHLLFYHLQEAANPGYLRRMQRRIERSGRTSWYGADDKVPSLPDLKQAFGGK